MDIKERYSRQSLLVPEKIIQLPISIIGCGAIGRNVALQLISIGAETLDLYDFDIVEESNIASQGFLESQLGMTKVRAVKDSCLNINAAALIAIHEERFVKSNQLQEVVFCCVDTMEGRKLISNAAKRQQKSFFIDGRMSGETARILSFNPSNEKDYDYYNSTLLSDEQAHTGTCTAKSTIYCSNIISGFMISVLTKRLKEMDPDIDKDFMIDINNREIFPR